MISNVVILNKEENWGGLRLTEKGRDTLWVGSAGKTMNDTNKATGDNQHFILCCTAFLCHCEYSENHAM